MTVHALILVSRSPLQSVAGVPLLLRNIMAAAESGIDKITIMHDRTTELAPVLVRARELRPELILREQVPGQWDPLGPGPFLLLHTDAWISPAAVKQLVAQDGDVRWPAADEELPAARLSNAHALPDTTERGDWLQALSKLDSIPAAPGYFPVGNRRQRGRAERGLFSSLIKPSDGMVSRYLNRPISTRISQRLVRFNIRPLQLTAVTALAGLAMLTAFLFGGEHGVVLGCLLFHLASVLDGLDGEIARAKFLASRRGAAWDTGVDMVTNLLFIVGLMVALSSQHGTTYVYLGAYLFGLSLLAVIWLTLLLRFGPGGGSFDVVGQALKQRLNPWPRVQSVIMSLEKCFKRDFYAFAFAIMAVLGLAHAIPWLLAAGVSLWLMAIVINTPYLLSVRPADILPDHIKSLRP